MVDPVAGHLVLLTVHRLLQCEVAVHSVHMPAVTEVCADGYTYERTAISRWFETCFA